MITYQSEIQEFETHQFSAFASDLYDEVPDLKGGFPKAIKTDIGNRQVLRAVTKKVNADGDIQYVRYIQDFGCISVIIYND